MKKGIAQSNNTTRFSFAEVKRNWVVIDVKNRVLGRVATEIAKILRGKNNPGFTPNIDTGGFVIVLNANQVKLTGKRSTLKNYLHHSLYPGGQKSISFTEMINKQPEKVIRYAVRGMLPKNKLGNKLITKLKIYKGDTHPHSAQKPEVVN